MSDTHGPNFTKLMLRFVARLAIPKGGGIANGLEFFQNKELRQQILKQAEIDTEKAIQLVKSAPDNSYGQDDEAIAGALLEKIKEREKTK